MSTATQEAKRMNGKAAALVDPSLIREYLPLFMAPGQVTELRVLEGTTASDRYARPYSGYFDDGEKLILAAQSLRSAKGIYIVPNPCDPALMARGNNRLRPVGKDESTKNTEILRRTRLLIDFDAKRPTGISSTDDEHAAAIQKAFEVRDALEAEGLPRGAISSSGNGAHLEIATDEPADDGELFKRCLLALDQRFSDERIHVDTSVHNAARIWKLKGSLACKGDSMEDRPHRMARVLDAPDELRVATHEQLVALADSYAPPVKESKPATNGHAKRASVGADVVQQARNYISAIPGAVAGENGSGQTIKVAGHLVRGFNLPRETALMLLREWNEKCEPPWSDADLEHKIDDAEKHPGERGYKLRENRKLTHASKAPKQRADRNDVGAVDGPATNLRNYELVPKGEPEEGEKQKYVCVPASMAKIIEGVRACVGDWPRRVDSGLFIHDTQAKGVGGEVDWLTEQAALFGFLQSRACVDWKTGDGYITKSELFAELRRTSRAHLAVECLPHEPELVGHYYACPAVSVGDGDRLQWLLDRFCPAEPIDRDLIQAALLTIFWGGRGGTRPVFNITSDDGRGAGKSKLAEMFGHVAGGTIDFSPNEDFCGLKTRLLSPDALVKRIAMLDNLKSLRFSWAEFEGLITAPTISGRRLYVGEASRPNTLTWFVTLNGASLSTDMAQRSCVIKIKRPKRSATWEEETIGYIQDHRAAIIGDIVAALRAEPFTLAKFSRWASWERDVLSRLPDPEEAQRVILERQAVVDVEQEETAIIEDHFAEQLRRVGYDPDRDIVHIPVAVAARWLNWATGDKKSVQGASSMLKQMANERRLHCIQENRCHTFGRGFLWSGEFADVETRVNYDLNERLSKHRTDATG